MHIVPRRTLWSAVGFDSIGIQAIGVDGFRRTLGRAILQGHKLVPVRRGQVGEMTCGGPVGTRRSSGERCIESDEGNPDLAGWCHGYFSLGVWNLQISKPKSPK